MKLLSIIGAAGLLAMLAGGIPACAPFASQPAVAATTPSDEDLSFRRFRGDDEVSDDDRRGRGRGRGRGGSDDSGGGSGGGGGGKDGGKGGGGKHGGGGKSNPADSGDRFGR